MGMVVERAGAEVPSANRITLLRDTDGERSCVTPMGTVPPRPDPFFSKG